MSVTSVRDRSASPPLALWGGVECTVNRVGDDYFDQLALNGHDAREEDLARFAELGIAAIRYPVLWERIAPHPAQPPDWNWSDRRLDRLRSLGIRPIVGLVHHGSGPPHTSLLDKSFATGLADFARQVAERYPWVDAYTPVNEPLTTARFSALYGHWYPHQRSDAAFVRALLNQCRAVILAMRAIREVNPSAQLVQTEDLGKVHSTPHLDYQARFENERRWLSFDLLAGRVTRAHELWNYLLRSGASERELDWFAEYATPPDIVGGNYYITSERFLDERLDHYPPHLHGGNDRHRYVDVEAVRVRGEGIDGLAALLEEAWERYRLPLAVTEVHLGCHRESQLRWLIDAWQAATELRRRGIDIRAITSWSLLGSYEWNSLCTRRQGHYEPGAFDLRAPQPRATAVAAAVHSLAQGKLPTHPALPARGWWDDDTSRLAYPPVSAGRATPSPVAGATANRQPVLIVGASGTLGRSFAWACQQRRLAHQLLSRREADITSPRAIEAAVERYQPWAIVNAAGYVRIDEAERDQLSCSRANIEGAWHLANVCSARQVRLVTFSSDLVFDGGQEIPYVERDPVRPLSTYGRCKAEAERQVLAADPEALVIRSSAFFGPWDEYNFLTAAMRRLLRGMTVMAAEDWVVSPTYLPDLVHACLDLLVDGEKGLWHLANHGAASWAQFARRAAQLAGLDDRLVQGCPGESLRLPAPRPRFSVLGSERGQQLPDLDDGLTRYCRAASDRWA